MSNELRIKGLKINGRPVPQRDTMKDNTWLSEHRNYLFKRIWNTMRLNLGPGIYVISLFAAPLSVLDRVAFTHSLRISCESVLSDLNIWQHNGKWILLTRLFEYSIELRVRRVVSLSVESFRPLLCVEFNAICWQRPMRKSLKLSDLRNSSRCSWLWIFLER